MLHSVSAIVLAAGKGTRMNSDLPKVLHKVAGRPLITYVIAALEPLELEQCVIVLGPNQGEIEGLVKPAKIVIQTEARGTGDAVRVALGEFRGFKGTIFVAYGADPLISSATLHRMLDLRRENNPPDIIVLGFETDCPGQYGRLVQDQEGLLERIVEAADVNTIDRTVRLYNGGVMAIDGEKLPGLVENLSSKNSKGEFYLTDIIAVARKSGSRIAVVEAPESETIGVDSRADLARAEFLMQQRLRKVALESGVSMIAPETVFLSYDTVIGRDTVLHPNITFGTGVRIGNGVEIKSFSHIEGAIIENRAVIGPYARLRPGAEIGEGARVGNFVEIKQSTIGSGTKINHLSYVGDAKVGKDTNVGAGTITCNFDGFHKHSTEIGSRVFIGSNSALIAPIEVGDGAIIGAGSTVTTSVPPDGLMVERGQAKQVPDGARKD